VNIAICDDEEDQIEILESIITSSSFFKAEPPVFYTFTSGEDLIAAFKKTKPEYDLIFLDNRLNTTTGEAVFQELKLLPGDKRVVFVSSYMEYVTSIYDLRPFHIIQKPVTQANVDRVLELALIEYNRDKTDNFTVSDGSRTLTFSKKEILYLESKLHYITVKSIKNSECKYRGLISDAESALLLHGFVRSHQGFLVNLRYVSSIEKRDVILKNGDSVPVSKEKRPSVQDAFLKYTGGE
jgi:DNA-binding LytR/AlgR family response regulator